jgi:hypothetical protein
MGSGPSERIQQNDLHSFKNKEKTLQKPGNIRIKNSDITGKCG